MKKIFFLNSKLNLGGAEKMLYEVVRNLDRTKFKLKVCCLYSPGLIARTLMVEDINLSHSLMNNKYELVGIYRLLLQLKKEQVDLLFIENSPLTLFWGFIFGRILKVPCIMTIVQSLTTKGWFNRLKSEFVDRLILRRLNGIIVVSRAKLNSLVKKYHLQSDKIALIYNAIDLERFKHTIDKSYLKQKIGIAKDERVIGMVGRLVNEKAYDIFLKSAKKIIDCVPQTKFLIIGDGKERRKLEKLAKILGIRKRVIFLGERQDIPDLISLFDIAVLSSRVESCPLALLEYMSASRPIVVTNVGGNTEIISHGESGVIVPPEDPWTLATAVIELLNDSSKAEKIGRLARKRIEERFSSKQRIEKIERFILDCTNDKISICLMIKKFI